MVAAYGKDSFGTHPENAMPNLFTFLRYPGMPSTNNETEQDIRDAVVVQRKIRQKFVTPEGMQVFSIMMSFHSTCRKLNVIPSEMFERMIESPGFDFMSYGLSVLNPKALPAPADAGVERGCTAGTIQCQDATGSSSEPDPSHTGTAATPMTIPDNIMATIAMVATTVCDLTDGPARPNHPTCNTTAKTGQNRPRRRNARADCGSVRKAASGLTLANWNNKIMLCTAGGVEYVQTGRTSSFVRPCRQALPRHSRVGAGKTSPIRVQPRCLLD